MKYPKLPFLTGFLLSSVFYFSLSPADSFGQEQKINIVADRAQAMKLVGENKYLEAYPVLEKLAGVLPNDVDIITHFGIAVATRTATLNDPQTRKAERKRAYELLFRAKQLGTRNVMALEFLDTLPADGGTEDNFKVGNPEVEAALREGEGYFGHGEYDKAFAAYQRALKIDPKCYEAALFLGDTLYAQNKNVESEPWFAKAASIDPDRELAYRYWGDALMAQGKVHDAREKFIDAFVADPYSRYSWDSLNKLSQKLDKPIHIAGIIPPGLKPFEEIILKTELLNEQDGTKFWLKYKEVRDRWKTTTFAKEYPSKAYRDSLKEEFEALRSVAEVASRAIDSGQLKTPHNSISNLVELNKKGLLEPYILILMGNEDVSNEYEDYRIKNRDKIRKFLSEYIFTF